MKKLIFLHACVGYTLQTASCLNKMLHLLNVINNLKK